MTERALPKEHMITAGDLYERAKNTGVSWLSESMGPSETVLRGTSDFLELRDGLSVHYSDAVDMCDFQVETETKPHLGIKIFLEGSIDAQIGGINLPMAKQVEGTTRWKPLAFLFAQTKTECFVRKTHKGNHLRKVIIEMNFDWLNNCGIADNDDLSLVRDFANCHLAIRTWVPSAKAIATAEQILNAPQQPSLLHAIYIESRVLSLIAEALQQLYLQPAEPQLVHIRPQDRSRLNRIKTFLKQHRGSQVSAESLAQMVGVSVNTLQRLFQNAHNTSVSNYVRKLKLNQARSALESEGVSIAEAAYVAGYGSPANFATAYKRQFGLSPSESQSGL